jgi:DNA-binding NarL/FixJ family response regulator
LENAIAFAFATASPSLSGPAGSGAVTRREHDVLRLVVEGQTDREIAAALFIGHRTVGSHVTSLLAKLGVSSRAALAAHAVRDSLV